jgi:hypothetical protein
LADGKKADEYENEATLAAILLAELMFAEILVV